MMIRAPEKTPADPIPAMVRPRMRATEEGAAPQSAEPTSNSEMARTKTVFAGAKAYAFPKTSWNEHVVNRYALPYHDTSFSEWNVSVMRGIAVEMIRLSCISPRRECQKQKKRKGEEVSRRYKAGATATANATHVRTSATRKMARHSARTMSVNRNPEG